MALITPQQATHFEEAAYQLDDIANALDSLAANIKTAYLPAPDNRFLVSCTGASAVWESAANAGKLLLNVSRDGFEGREFLAALEGTLAHWEQENEPHIQDSELNDTLKHMMVYRTACNFAEVPSTKAPAGADDFLVHENRHDARRFAATARHYARRLRREAAKKAGKRSTMKRRRTAATRGLTDLQKQALELYGKLNGRIGKIAEEMGVTHATVNQHLNAGWRKLPNLAPKKTAPTGRMRRLPKDKRGQSAV